MAEDYRALAEKCRSLARRMTDDRTIDALSRLAREYDAKAEAAPEAGIEGPFPGSDEAPGSNESEGPMPRPE